MPGPTKRNTVAGSSPVASPDKLAALGSLGAIRTVLDDGDGRPARYIKTSEGWLKIADPDSVSYTESEAGQQAPKNLTSVDSPYTVADVDRFLRCNTTNGQIILLLPSASAVPGREIRAKIVAGGINPVVFLALEGESVDGQNTRSFQALYDSQSVQADGDNTWDRV